MTWIRVDHEAPGDDKIAQLAEALRIADAHAFGLAVAVWCAVSIHAPNGNIGAISDRALESWAKWSGRRTKFAAAFRALFQRPDGTLSGWQERQGKLIERMEKDRARHRKGSTEDPQNPPRKFQGASAEIPALRNVTVRTTGSSGSESDFQISLTTAANQGITARFGEQTTPLIWSAPGSIEATESVRASGVPPDFAVRAVYSAAASCQAERAPKSLKYFVPQVLRAWEEERARAQIGSLPPPDVIPLTHTDRRKADTRAKITELLRGTQ